METIRFKNDAPTRRRLYTDESWSHPAKGHLGMWAIMIERYSKPGDLVLDPMSGVGATLLAALLGRNVICVEMEEHFVEPMRRSWAKMQQHPMLGYAMGSAVILRGDARALPLPDASAGAVVTSPPFQNQVPAQDPTWFEAHRLEFGGGTTPGSSYTSPPQVDCVVTSPPFGEAQSGGGIAIKGYGDNDPGMAQRVYSDAAHNHSALNIGNLRAAAYWSAIEQVYAECWRVLRPGGIMALVLKGFTRDGKYVDLPGQTEAMLLTAGWVKHDHWLRELWSLSFWRILQRRRDPAAFDDRLKHETVLALRKPGGVGDGVATILTSPPYEEGLGHQGSVQREILTTKGIHGGSRNYTEVTRPVSLIVTSSPYEGTAAEGPSGIDWAKQADGRKKQEPHGVGSHPWGYTRVPRMP